MAIALASVVTKKIILVAGIILTNQNLLDL